MGIWYDDDEDWYCSHVSARKVGHPLGHGQPHIPNKEEAKELRRLMQKSGETEEQVRSKIENRRLLAKAAKSPMKSSGDRYEYECKQMQKSIAKYKGLPGWHPEVQKELRERLVNQRLRCNGMRWW